MRRWITFHGLLRGLDMSCSLSKVRIQQIKPSARLCYITYPQPVGGHFMDFQPIMLRGT